MPLAFPCSSLVSRLPLAFSATGPARLPPHSALHSLHLLRRPSAKLPPQLPTPARRFSPASMIRAGPGPLGLAGALSEPPPAEHQHQHQLSQRLGASPFSAVQPQQLALLPLPLRGSSSPSLSRSIAAQRMGPTLCCTASSSAGLGASAAAGAGGTLSGSLSSSAGSLRGGGASDAAASFPSPSPSPSSAPSPAAGTASALPPSAASLADPVTEDQQQAADSEDEAEAGAASPSTSGAVPAASQQRMFEQAAEGLRRSEEELNEELRRRWKQLPDPVGPSPFPEFTMDPDTQMWTSPSWGSDVDMRRHIFCNRSLNMKSIEAVGFDMDYTLAQYKAETFEALAYSNCLEKLVNKFGYPKDLLSWEFDWKYMLRGLVLDKKRGNILKMDRHKYVKVAYHGFREMSGEERRRTYNSTRARESFDEPDYALIDTLFSLAEAYLIAQLVDFCDMFPSRCPPQVVAPGAKTVNYEAIYKNVRSAVDLCHRDGTLKSAVAQNPSKYLSQDDQIVPMLKMIRDSGRKVFLVTNSLWDYTHVVMNCLAGNDGLTPETARTYDWLKLFDVVITGSAKPGFFMDNNRAPVFEVDVTTGMLYNTDEGSPTAQIGDIAQPEPLTARAGQACQVFQGGSVGHLHRILNIDSGSQVLYVGDHIYGDILRSKKTLGWRTMLVVPELVREVHVLHRTATLQRAFHGYRHQIDSLDDTIQRMAWALRFDGLPEEKKKAVAEEMKVLKVQRDAARGKYQAVMNEWHSHFHPVWGMLMKTGYQNSRFAHQVERFACLYTSHVANLAYYSPDKNYRTVEDFMPHETDILS